MQGEATVAFRNAETFVEFANAISRDNVPERVIQQAKACFLDSIACGLFGSRQPWGEMMGARVELRLSGGEVRTSAALDAHGTPADPCTDAERRERFVQLASAARPSPAVDSILDVVNQIDALSSVRALSQALRG